RRYVVASSTAWYFRSFRWNIEYKIGKTNNVRSVDEMIPPITTVASGLWTSAPVPVLSAIGTKPRLATNAVIKTGRRRTKAPSTTAVTRSPCSRHRSRMKATITRPLRTATPESAIKPTPAEIDSGMPRSHRDNTPPVSASGTPVKIIKAPFNELFFLLYTAITLRYIYRFAYAGFKLWQLRWHQRWYF